MKKRTSKHEGLHLWNVRATGFLDIINVLTSTDDSVKAARKANRWLQNNGFLRYKITSIDYRGTIDA